jgi:hypothetical protein
MKTLTLTSFDFDSNGIYIGKTDLSNFDGNLKIEIGYAYFPKLVIVTGSIEASDSIEAGGYIEAGGSIKADGYIKASYYIKAGGSIKADGFIEASYSIEASDSIEAGGYIKAGGSIKTDGYIKAGYSIEAGLNIVCKKLSTNLRIFAGVCTWKTPNDDEMMITCEELVKGIVCFGQLSIIKSKKQTPSCAGKVVEIDGKKYKLVEA